MGDDEDRLVPASIGAVWLGKLSGVIEVDKELVKKNAALIRKWASRGRIKQHDGKLYSLRELEEVSAR